jgi:uncharacterized protein
MWRKTMTDAHTDRKQVLFVHGGEDGYKADAKLAASLQEALGATYNVRYPHMPNDDAPDFGWGRQIGQELGAIKGEGTEHLSTQFVRV